MHGRARLDGSSGEFTGESERLNCPAATVNPARLVLHRAEVSPGLNLVQESDVSPALCPLLGPLANGLDRICIMCRLDPSIASMRYRHLVLGDEVEHDVGGATCEIHDPTARLRAEHRFNF